MSASPFGYDRTASKEQQAMTTKKRTTTRELEQKFEDTAFRLTQERSDFLLPQIVDFVRARKWMNLRPEYQRRLVWDVEKRSLFIESLLLNVPIPPVFLYEWELSRYEVMDGQQRLNAVVDFYDNGFALKGLEKWTELAGYRYRELPDTLQRGLDRRRLSATVLLVERPKDTQPQHSDIRRLVFDRLNTGGLQLNSQELRNCLYESAFNRKLIELSRDEEFQRAWDIPLYSENVDASGGVREPLASDRYYRRMIDCEIVLRFFAFRGPKKLKGSVRSMLDKCMEDHVDVPDEHVEREGQEYRDRLNVAVKMFGRRAFRYEDDDGNLHLSQPLYDAVMVAVDRLWDRRAALIRQKAQIQESLARLLKKEDAYAVIVGRPNTAKAIEARIDLMERVLRKAI
jgi:hypothetical protein